MGELLDRPYQLEILRTLAEAYPGSINPRRTFGDQPDNRLLVNLFYLAEHNLLKLQAQKLQRGDFVVGEASITAKGLDFLADDGGLGAILGTITVKLHDDTIRALLIEKVAASDADSGTKERLIDAIRSLPADGLTKLAHKAMDAGIDHLPEAIEPLQNWLGF